MMKNKDIDRLEKACDIMIERMEGLKSGEVSADQCAKAGYAGIALAYATGVKHRIASDVA